MKPSVQKIITKLSKNQVELAAEKVELARKPKSLLKDIEKLDSSMAKQEAKIEKAFLQYKKIYDEWDAFTDLADKDFVSIGTDFGLIVKSLNDLGVSPASVPEMVKADQIMRKLQSIVANSKSLYKEPR